MQQSNTRVSLAQNNPGYYIGQGTYPSNNYSQGGYRTSESHPSVPMNNVSQWPEKRTEMQYRSNNPVSYPVEAVKR